MKKEKQPGTIKKTQNIIFLTITTFLAKTTKSQTPIYNRNAQPGNRVVVPRQAIGWYPMYDVSYTANFYVTTGRDDINWGKLHNTETSSQARSARRAYIEAIQDHECWTESSKDVPRDICVACGIGGCERWDFVDFTGEASMRNISVFRHRIYWDDTTGNMANTYRTEAISTVAIIDRTNYFLTGGSEERSIARFNIFNNASYRIYPALTNISPTNRTKEVVDIIIIKPTPFFVFTRTQEEYELGDYTLMSRIKTFGRNLADHRGGFGDYIDWAWDKNRVAISADYQNIVNVYDTANAPGAEYQRSHTTAAGVRAVAGIFDSPFFGVATLNQIQVFSTYENHGTNVITTFTETLSGPDRNIWDIKYIDSANYDGFDYQNNPAQNRLITSEIHTYRGPNEYDARIEDQIMNARNGIPEGVPVTERFFYTTKDQAKIVWWKDGTGEQCHPYCNNDCYLAFTRRKCRGVRCANRADWIGDITPSDPAPPPGTYTSDPYLFTLPTPNVNDLRGCLPQTEQTIMNYHGGDPIIFNVENEQSPALPFSIPHSVSPPREVPVLTGEINGVANSPPFFPVAQNSTARNDSSTEAQKPIRGPASEWWKWAMLGLIGALLVGLVVGALLLQKTPPIRRPVVQVMEEKKVLVKKPEVVQEKVYQSVPRKTKVEKVVIEKTVKADTRISDRRMRTDVVEKRNFNPYKKKN